MALLSWLLGMFLSLIPKGIVVENFPVATTGFLKLTLHSLASIVRIQPRSYGDRMELT